MFYSQRLIISVLRLKPFESSVIYTIPPNLPLSALRFFSLLRFGKTKRLFCSRLNRNVRFRSAYSVNEIATACSKPRNDGVGISLAMTHITSLFQGTKRRGNLIYDGNYGGIGTKKRGRTLFFAIYFVICRWVTTS